MNKDKVTTVIKVNEKYISNEISEMNGYNPEKIQLLLSIIEETIRMYCSINYLTSEQAQIVAEIAQTAIIYHIYKKWSICVRFIK